MRQDFEALAFVAVLFFGMLVALEAGYRFGRRRHGKETGGQGAVEGAVFALLGLLVAFTFSGAAARFDWRRGLIVEEANAIGTAYLRVDVLPAAVQPPLRETFRRYVDSRLAIYRALPDVAAAYAALERSNAIQRALWTAAVEASHDAPGPAAILLLPALNQMIDITTTRTAATFTHPPVVVFGMLGGLALVCALFAGHGMGVSPHRSWLHMIIFAAVIALTVFVILDLEYPRLGLVRVESFDQLLVEAREAMP